MKERFLRMMALPICFMGTLTLATSCGEPPLDADVRQEVSLAVDGFTTMMEGADSKATAEEATDKIAVAVFDVSGSNVFAETQILSDSTSYATYGVFHFSLTQGEYLLVAVGYRSAGTLSIVSPTHATFTGAVPDCFVGARALSVNGGGSSALMMSLSRPVAKFTVQDTLNPFPSSVKTVEARFSSGSRSFNPVTGFAVSNTGYTRTLNTSSIPYAHPVFNYHVFLNAEAQTMDVSLTCRDSQGVVNYQKTIPSVPLRRNCVTRAVGSLFNAATATSFTFNTTFSSDTTITF